MKSLYEKQIPQMKQLLPSLSQDQISYIEVERDSSTSGKYELASNFDTLLLDIVCF